MLMTWSLSPLAILDAANEHRVPQRIQLASPAVHHVRQVLVYLLGAKRRVAVGEGFGALLDAEVWSTRSQ